MTRTTLQGFFYGSMMFAAASNANATIQTIDFDTDASGNAISAPSLFAGATPLTDLYATSGVTFSALSRDTQSSLLPKDGIEVNQTYNVMNTSSSGMGAILNEASNFGGNAKSGDNFLAFNNQSSSSANFWRINFADPINYFNISYSPGSTTSYQYLNFQAYDVDGHLIGGAYNYYLNSYYQSYFNESAFKSQTDIAYIDIGQGLEYDYNQHNLSAGLRSGTWSLRFDNLIFGDYADAPYYAFDISGQNGGTYVPVPASIWMMFSGLAGILGIRKKSGRALTRTQQVSR